MIMIQSLDRAIDILEHLAEHKIVGCTEMASIMGVSKSTIFRLLDTMAERNLVCKVDDSGKYMLGFGLLHLSQSLLNNTDIMKIVYPVMEDIAKEVQESVHFCALSNDQALILAQVKSSDKINISATIGSSEPMHCASVGKCLLAFIEPQKSIDIIKSLAFEKYTEKTITTRGKLCSELETIRMVGYAVDNEELNVGIRCLAAPIYNYKGLVESCVGISGTVARITEEKTKEYGEIIVRYATVISRLLGYKI